MLWLPTKFYVMVSGTMMSDSWKVSQSESEGAPLHVTAGSDDVC